MVVVKKDAIFVDDPVLTSRAAFLLLRKVLAEEQLMNWLSFRESFLEGKELTCRYCGKQDLKKSIESKEDLDVLATIDHIVPTSKGGGRYDESNLLIACFPCNSKKRDLLPEEFACHEQSGFSSYR